MQTWRHDLTRRYPRLVVGASSGALFGVMDYVATRSVGSALFQGLIGGALFGAFIGPDVARSRLRVDALIGDVPAVDRIVVERAARRGPVPADPHLRAAAARLTQHRLEESRRTVKRNVVVFALLLLVALPAALTSSPWWCLAGAWVACLLVSTMLEPRRLERRLALLQDETAPSSQG